MVQEPTVYCASTFQVSAYITHSNIILAKTSHVVKPMSTKQGSTCLLWRWGEESDNLPNRNLIHLNQALRIAGKTCSSLIHVALSLMEETHSSLCQWRTMSLTSKMVQMWGKRQETISRTIRMQTHYRYICTAICTRAKRIFKWLGCC